MSTHKTWVVMCGLVLACSQHPPFELPQPISGTPTAGPDGLYAGFGKVDITPPPGIPLSGNSLEGQQATGYRHRLYARALVLEDRRGERLALVTADLGLLSSNLHRLTADRVKDRTGIGADRLILSVTHTHAGPGNHHGVRSYNHESAAYEGYDPAMVEFLVEKFTRAVEEAFDMRQPAVAAWDTVVVPAADGLTRNRSFDAFRLNRNPLTVVRDSLPGETREQTIERQRREAVDRVFRLLRVDRCDLGWTNCRPLGAFSIFAIHGTGNPAINSLLDGDIHAIVERELERHIESLNPMLPSSDPTQCAARNEDGSTAVTNCAFRSRAFHLFANGTEGDVSPYHDRGTRCAIEEPDRRIQGGDATLIFRAGRRPAGPRTPVAPEAWRRVGPRRVDDCLQRARQSTNRIGRMLSEHAIRAFTKAGSHLTRDLPIRRAFRSYNMVRDTLTPAVCPEPRSGTSNLAGAEDGRTRMYKWRFLFFIPSGIEEGGSAINPDPTGCFGAKLVALGPLQGHVVKSGGLPEFPQLAVVRIGNGLLGVVPAEVTTEAGMRMKQRMREAAPAGVDHVGIVGLANGYMQYITTREEYSIQSYEGGSNLYGPATAEAFATELETLSRSLASDRPVVRVEPITATPGHERKVLFERSRGPRVSRITRRIIDLSCAGGAITARWVDAYPGLFVTADGQVLELQRRNAEGRWDVVAWDDDRFVEVHAVGPKGSGYEWRVRYAPTNLLAGAYRLALVERRLGDEGTFAALPRQGAPVPVVECG